MLSFESKFLVQLIKIEVNGTVDAALIRLTVNLQPVKCTLFTSQTFTIFYFLYKIPTKNVVFLSAGVPCKKYKMQSRWAGLKMGDLSFYEDNGLKYNWEK